MAESALEKENKRQVLRYFCARQRKSDNPMAYIDVHSVSNIIGLMEDEAPSTYTASSSLASSININTIINPVTSDSTTAHRAVLLPSSTNTTVSNVSLTFDRRKGLTSKSRRMPHQKAAFEAERKITFKANNAAYG
jgi:hypothetical protein